MNNWRKVLWHSAGMFHASLLLYVGQPWYDTPLWATVAGCTVKASFSVYFQGEELFHTNDKELCLERRKVIGKHYWKGDSLFLPIRTVMLWMSGEPSQMLKRNLFPWAALRFLYTSSSPREGSKKRISKLK